MTTTNKSSKSSNADLSYDDWLKSFYEEMRWKPLFLNWDNKPTPIWKILKQANRTADKAEKFLNKLNSAKTSSSNRVKLVPEKATVRREYIKCGKTSCHRRHGPYYYAYWKDANSGKLKKKYIGKYFKKQEKVNVSSEIPTIKEVDIDRLLHNINGNKIQESRNNLDKVKLKQKKKKDKRILSVAN